MEMQKNFIRSIMLRKLCILHSTSQACHTIQQHCCLTDRLLAYSRELQLSPNPADAEVEMSLQEKGIAGLQYLGCYEVEK